MVNNHFLKPIIKGWYVITDPRAMPGDSTAWEAIIIATPTMYRNDALTMRTALAMVHDGSDILKIWVDTGQIVREGRVIGAFRNIGRTDIADEIAGTMKRMGYTVYEEDLFEKVMEIHASQSPYTFRLRLMWQKYERRCNS